MVSKGTTERRRAQGVCIKCGGKLAEGHKILCDVHREKQNEANRRSTNNRRRRDRLMGQALANQGGVCAVGKEDISGGDGVLFQNWRQGHGPIALCQRCAEAATKALIHGTAYVFVSIKEAREND